MARHIDLDRLLKGLEYELKDKNPNDIAYLVFKLFIGRLNQEPTADVVPKSEVDKWKEINEQLHKEMSERMLEEVKVAKKYLAREIFEEIDVLVDDYKHSYIQSIQFIAELAELKKKYTEEEA